jgi:anti-sigma B factor antagonist
MEIREHIEHDVVIVELKGTLHTEKDANLLRDRIYGCVGKNQTHLVFDLLHLTYINSWGLGLLIALLNMVRKNGGDLRLARVGGQVHNLFIVTQLSKAFVTFEGVPEAVKSFRQA